MPRSPTTKANKETKAAEGPEPSAAGATTASRPPQNADSQLPADAALESHWCKPILFQGWLSVAVWMTFGLLLEGLLGYKTPAYLLDNERRELFRLAHAHGTLLGLVLIASALSGARFSVSPPRPALTALRLGALVLPLGFLLAGLWHYESDPGLAIWLVPPAAPVADFRRGCFRAREPQRLAPERLRSKMIVLVAEIVGTHKQQGRDLKDDQSQRPFSNAGFVRWLGEHSKVR